VQLFWRKVWSQFSPAIHFSHYSTQSPNVRKNALDQAFDNSLTECSDGLYLYVKECINILVISADLKELPLRPLFYLCTLKQSIYAIGSKQVTLILRHGETHLALRDFRNLFIMRGEPSNVNLQNCEKCRDFSKKINN